MHRSIFNVCVYLAAFITSAIYLFAAEKSFHAQTHIHRKKGRSSGMFSCMHASHTRSYICSLWNFVTWYAIYDYYFYPSTTTISQWQLFLPKTHIHTVNALKALASISLAVQSARCINSFAAIYVNSNFFALVCSLMHKLVWMHHYYCYY